MKISLSLSTRMMLVAALLTASMVASGQVALSSASPTVAEPGLTTVRLLGSGFPSGSLNPANIQILITPQAGGSPVSTPATQYQNVIGTTGRVSFVVPATLIPNAPGLYSLAISDSTDGFSSSNSTAITVTPLASIVSVTPGTGSPGQAVDITLVGVYSHFLSGLTQVAVTGGITASALTVTSPTSLTVRLTIGSATGPQTVTVSTGAEVENSTFTATQTTTVLVPNVVGDTQTTATNVITGAGLVLGTVTTQFSNSVPSGAVISQSPVGGGSVSPGSAVNLVISLGPNTVLVPNVVGDTQTTATLAIASATLSTGNLVYQTSTTVPVGSVISQFPAAGASVAAGTKVNLVISAPLLSAGQNEADSNLISLQSGAIGSQQLPSGQNEACSNTISLQTGLIGSPGLPTGQNEAVSNLFSVQDGVIGSSLLPSGRNDVASNLISVSNTASSLALLTRANNISLSSNSLSGAAPSEEPLGGSTLEYGETVSLSANVPAQIWLNNQRAGNDQNSTTQLTFVVPEHGDALTIRPADSAQLATLLQRQTSVWSGQVVDAAGAGIAGAHVHLRHSGLEAQVFQLSANSLAQEVPSIAGLSPSIEQPVSSLNLHNPNQALGYFPIGVIDAPNFAVLVAGQFLAQTSGTYSFYIAATQGAQFSMNGSAISTVHNTQPGLETSVSVALSEGWHDISFLVYAKTGYGELVVSYAPPGENRQIINPRLLRGESSTLAAVTTQGGEFKIVAPGWLDQVEAIATRTTTAGPQVGSSAVAQKGQSNLGQVYLAPR